MENLDTFKTLPDHSLLEALPCCVLLQRGDRIVYCNRAARGLIGLAEDAAVDRPVSDIFLGTYPGLKLVREELVVNADADSELGVDINANEDTDRPRWRHHACQL